MSTPTKERGDLLIRTIWKHQTDCILAVRTPYEPRRSIQHSLETGSRPFFPMSVKSNEIPLGLPGSTPSLHFAPFVVSCDGVLGNEAKVLQYYQKSLQEASPRYDIRKVLFRNFRLHEVKGEHCNCTRHTSRMGQHPHLLFSHIADHKHIAKLNNCFQTANSVAEIK